MDENTRKSFDSMREEDLWLALSNLVGYLFDLEPGESFFISVGDDSEMDIFDEWWEEDDFDDYSDSTVAMLERLEEWEHRHDFTEKTFNEMAKEFNKGQYD